MKKKIDSTLFTAILYIVVGVLLAVFPGDMLKWAMLIAGIFFVVSGILEIVKKNWAGGTISLIMVGSRHRSYCSRCSHRNQGRC